VSDLTGAAGVAAAAPDAPTLNGSRRHQTAGRTADVTDRDDALSASTA
jgi:hypothetical protein